LAWEFIAQGPLRSAHIVQVGQILWGEEYQLKRREETGREERKGNRERELEEEWENKINGTDSGERKVNQVKWERILVIFRMLWQGLGWIFV
jgi:hypothetical protein